MSQFATEAEHKIQITQYSSTKENNTIVADKQE